MPLTELWQHSAVQLAKLIRRGVVSSVEVVHAHLARLERVNPRINAIVLALEEEAREQASIADSTLLGGHELGLLHGVPVATKINTDQRGCPTDNAVVSLKDLIATEDSPLVANLRRAGAVFIGRTNVPAFSMRWFTDNDVYGRTVNPWSESHTSGGSSGGAGAAVAAGICPIAQGNDIAGSIRYPAFCCGIFGLKPTFGRIPTFNFTARAPSLISGQILSVQGPLARHVCDLRLAFKAMSGTTPLDPRCVDVALPPARRRPLSVALAVKLGGHAAHPAIEASIRRVGQYLQAVGYSVDEVSLPNFDETAQLWPDLAMPDSIAQLEQYIAGCSDAGIKRAVALWRECWPQRDPATCLAALGSRLILQRSWLAFMERYPVVVMPTSMQLPFEWGEDIRDVVATSRILAAQAPMLAISVLGFPALAAPTGLYQGLPIGVQIVAGPHNEDLCFEVGDIIEANCPMPMPPIAGDPP